MRTSVYFAFCCIRRSRSKGRTICCRCADALTERSALDLLGVVAAVLPRAGGLGDVFARVSIESIESKRLDMEMTIDLISSGSSVWLIVPFRWSIVIDPSV